ncbi:MAG: hypothetical protein H7301_12660 [Cryobacterium sp.]|nr:hypothetical protein [Oligoflexia bacterium]
MCSIARNSNSLLRRLGLVALAFVCTSFSAYAARSSADGVRAAEMRAEAQREELKYLSRKNPFGTATPAAIDPITKKKYSDVIVGPAFDVRYYSPTFETRTDGGDFDYYRYVTFYDVERRSERFFPLPIQRQDCFDVSPLFAGYNWSDTYTCSITAGVTVEGIGLSSTFTAAKTVGNSHNPTPQYGIVADYIPMMEKQDWEGSTFIQTYNSKTHKTRFITREQKSSAWWVGMFFPTLEHGEYPMPFAVQDADWTFWVDVKVLKRCKNMPPQAGTPTAPSSTTPNPSVRDVQALRNSAPPFGK